MDNYVPPVLEEHKHIEPPDEDNMIAAIESFKNNKAPGSDDLPAKLCTNGGPEPVSYTHLFSIIDGIIDGKYMSEIP